MCQINRFRCCVSLFQSLKQQSIEISIACRADGRIRLARMQLQALGGGALPFKRRIQNARRLHSLKQKRRKKGSCCFLLTATTRRRVSGSSPWSSPKDFPCPMNKRISNFGFPPCSTAIRARSNGNSQKYHKSIGSTTPKPFSRPLSSTQKISGPVDCGVGPKMAPWVLSMGLCEPTTIGLEP